MQQWHDLSRRVIIAGAIIIAVVPFLVMDTAGWQIATSSTSAWNVYSALCTLSTDKRMQSQWVVVWPPFPQMWLSVGGQWELPGQDRAGMQQLPFISLTRGKWGLMRGFGYSVWLPDWWWTLILWLSSQLWSHLIKEQLLGYSIQCWEIEGILNVCQLKLQLDYTITGEPGVSYGGQQSHSTGGMILINSETSS